MLNAIEQNQDTPPPVFDKPLLLQTTSTPPAWARALLLAELLLLVVLRLLFVRPADGGLGTLVLGVARFDDDDTDVTDPSGDDPVCRCPGLPNRPGAGFGGARFVEALSGPASAAGGGDARTFAPPLPPLTLSMDPGFSRDRLRDRLTLGAAAAAAAAAGALTPLVTVPPPSSPSSAPQGA